MRIIFQEAAYDKAREQLYNSKQDTDAESHTDIVSNLMQTQDSEFSTVECKRGIKKDTTRTPILLEHRNFEQDYVQPWADSAQYNNYTQGDMTGSIPVFIELHRQGLHFTSPLCLTCFAYWNDNNELCGLTLIPKYRFNESLYSLEEPLSILLGITTNTIVPRYSANKGDPQQRLSLIELEPRKLKLKNFDAIAKLIQSKKVVSWIQLMLGIKEIAYIEAIPTLFKHCQVPIADSESSLLFDIAAIDSVPSLSKKELEALLEAKKNSEKQPVAKSLLFLHLISQNQSLNKQLQNFCQQQLIQHIFSPDFDKKPLTETNAEIQLIIDTYSLKTIFSKKAPTQQNHMAAITSSLESLQVHSGQIILILGFMIQLYRSLIQESPAPLKAAINETIATMHLTLKKLKAGTGGSHYTFIWNKFLITGMVDNGPHDLIHSNLLPYLNEAQQSFLFVEIKRVIGRDPREAQLDPTVIETKQRIDDIRAQRNSALLTNSMLASTTRGPSDEEATSSPDTAPK